VCVKVDDFFRLDRALQSAKSVAIIGGGFTGSELACALTKRGTYNTNCSVFVHNFQLNPYD